MNEYTRREVVRRSAAAAALAFVPVVPAISADPDARRQTARGLGRR